MLKAKKGIIHIWNDQELVPYIKDYRESIRLSETISMRRFRQTERSGKENTER
jgi:hypothetical protein